MCDESFSLAVLSSPVVCNEIDLAPLEPRLLPNCSLTVQVSTPPRFHHALGSFVELIVLALDTDAASHMRQSEHERGVYRFELRLPPKVPNRMDFEAMLHTHHGCNLCSIRKAMQCNGPCPAVPRADEQHTTIVSACVISMDCHELGVGPIQVYGTVNSTVARKAELCLVAQVL